MQSVRYGATAIQLWSDRVGTASIQVENGPHAGRSEFPLLQQRNLHIAPRLQVLCSNEHSTKVARVLQFTRSHDAIGKRFPLGLAIPRTNKNQHGAPEVSRNFLLYSNVLFIAIKKIQTAETRD